MRGYREGLARHRIPEEPALIRHPAFRAADAEDTARELLAGPDRPTALFTAQNLITLGALRTLHQLGLELDVALVGFDDVLLADVVKPAVTVIAQDPYAMGRTAATLLFSRLDGYDGPSRHEVLPTSLIERGSGEIPPS